VLSKALALGLQTVLVINKIDRQDARPREVLDQVYSLYIDLGADESQIDFPVLYAVARAGQASTSLAEPGTDLRPLFEAILSHIPPPPAPQEGDEKLRLLVANLDYDDYVGRLAIGRVHSGRIYPGEPVAIVRDGGKVEQGKVVKLYGFSGLKRVEIPDAGPGELVAWRASSRSASATPYRPRGPGGPPRIAVDEPTMMMVFRSATDRWPAGREYVTSRNLRRRVLCREAYRNVSIRVESTGAPTPSGWSVAASWRWR
jgi:GTP-binding protein